MISLKEYARPLPQVGPGRPAHALPLAGGWAWFTDVEILARGRVPRIAPALTLESDVLDRLSASRGQVAGLAMDAPVVMGILNATPDSFSNPGQHAVAQDAVAAGLEMIAAGAHVLDVGGESTRPGAHTVDPEEEKQRVVPVIEELRAQGARCLISIDTRKASVAEAALAAGAGLVNDVSGFTYDPALAPLCATHDAPICVVHALGDPATMQQNPTYDDVLLDVYDFLECQIAQLIAAGVPRAGIIADPGIGFGKTQDHNLALLSRLSLFHGLGVPILLGASRKGFIGNISGAKQAADRAAGSIGVALAAIGHGIQILRVHDVEHTIAAISLWQAAMINRSTGTNP